MYSPLRGDLQLTDGANVIVGALLTGGNTRHGVTYTHGFASGWLPDRCIVRLPAADEGAALFEAELSTT